MNKAWNKQYDRGTDNRVIKLKNAISDYIYSRKYSNINNELWKTFQTIQIQMQIRRIKKTGIIGARQIGSTKSIKNT